MKNKPQPKPEPKPEIPEWFIKLLKDQSRQPKPPKDLVELFFGRKEEKS